MLGNVRIRLGRSVKAKMTNRPTIDVVEERRLSGGAQD